MIPGIVSAELRDTRLDYMDMTFSFQDGSVEAALKAFLRYPAYRIYNGREHLCRSFTKRGS